MNTEIVKKKQRIEKKYLFISLALFIFELLLFILIKLEVFKSMDFSIQKNLQKNYSNSVIPIALTCIYYLNKIYVPYFIIIIVNNFSNISIIFNLFNILSITCYISCILKFVFYKIIISQKPDYYIIYYCGAGWNLPSTEMMISVAFFLTLWNCVYNNEEKYYISDKNKNMKYIFLGIIIIFNIANLIFLTTIGYYPFSNLIFSAILGVLIFIFVFWTNIIKNFTPKEFCRFVKRKFELYFLINIILLFLSFGPYIIERNLSSYNPPACISVDGSFYYKNNSTYITYIDDTFSLISIFFAHFFMMIGIKIEFCFYCENKIQIFYQYHFGINIEDLSMEKELRNNTGTIVLTAETEWNNTSKKISIIRLILSFILSGACFLPYILVEKGEDTNFSTIFLVKYFCSYSLFTLGISYLFRGIFRILKLTNEILDSILNDQ